MVRVRYICGACGYRWVEVYSTKRPMVMDRPIETPDCEACR
jgi:hypothetical protein